jgi:hypothetical protein
MDSTGPGEDQPRVTLDPNDPNFVSKLVDELKSQGFLDEVRKGCLAEVDTKVRITLMRYLHNPTYISENCVLRHKMSDDTTQKIGLIVVRHV